MLTPLQFVNRVSVIASRIKPRLLQDSFHTQFHRLSSELASSGKIMAPINKPVSETQHLRKGSTYPPNTAGLVRLYSMRYCPYAQRARLVLAAKQIPNEVVNCNLVEKPEWLFEKNPLGKVPCFELDGDVIFESLIVCDYVDEVYPKPRLLNSTDPLKKAHDRILVELFSKVTGLFFRIHRAYGSPDEAKKVFEELNESLDSFEKELAKRGTKFFGGSLPGMLDYMIWPWFERLPAVPILGGDDLKISEQRFPLLTSWTKSMLEDPAVQESYLSPEAHARFIRGYLAGAPDYDMENWKL